MKCKICKMNTQRSQVLDLLQARAHEDGVRMQMAKLPLEDAESPLQELPRLVRLAEVTVGDAQVSEGDGDLRMVGPELLLLDAKGPLQQLLLLARVDNIRLLDNIRLY